MAEQIKFDLTKIRPSVLRTKIASGHYTGAALESMKKELTKRETAKKKADKQSGKKVAPAEKGTKKAAPKKDAAAKKKPAKADGPKPLTIRDYLRQIITPKTGKVAAVTYSEAKALVATKFPNNKRKEALYTSEFDTVIKELMASEVIKERKLTVYKAAEGPKASSAAPAAKKTAPKKAAKKKTVKKAAKKADVTPATEDHEPSATEIAAASTDLPGTDALEEEEA